MGKYEALAKDIVAAVGGKENIGGLTHCITRLRFQLKDESKADDDAIKNMKGVVTLIKSAGQYQVVIGNHVQEVFQDVCAVAGIKGDSAQGEKKKLSVGATIIDFISSMFGKIIPVLCASGMIKGIVSLLVFVGWVTDGSGIHQILTACGDALFYFLPVLLGYSAAVKLGMHPFLGATIGAALMYPTIQGVDLEIFGMVFNVSYTSTVLPIVATCLIAAPLERFLNKVVPDVVKSFVTPMLVILITVPLGFCFIGVVANWVSSAISNVIMMLYNISPILAGLVMGAAWQVLVIFGIHMGLVAVGIVSLTTLGSTPIFALMAATTFAQTAVVMVIWAKTKDKNLKEIALPAWISGWFGVTEAAIYGVTLPRIKFFVISCIGAALGGAYIGFSGVVNTMMGGLGIFSLPTFLAQSTGDLMHVCIGIAIAMIFSGVATFILYKDEDTVDSKKKISVGQLKKIEITSPIEGKLVPLHKVNDAAFSQAALGKGIGIEPTSGLVKAPVSGKVTTLFPTKHALGITSDDGVEILIHIGLDTVQLEGKYFTTFVSQGDHVEAGQKLLEFDIKKIVEEGYQVTTPVVITNTMDYLDVLDTDKENLSYKDIIITILR